jgi:hypothetical protein
MWNACFLRLALGEAVSERMGEGKFSGLWSRVTHSGGDSFDARDLAHEAARARSVEQEQAERIRALEADNAAPQRWISEHGHRIGTMSCPHDGGYACEPGCVAYSIATASHPGAAASMRVKDETIKALANALDRALVAGPEYANCAQPKACFCYRCEMRTALRLAKRNP